MCWATTALLPFIFPSGFGGWAALESSENLVHVPFIFSQARTTTYCLSQFDRTHHQLKKSQSLLLGCVARTACLRARAASSASLTGMPLKIWWPVWRTRARLSTGPWTCKTWTSLCFHAKASNSALQFWKICGFKGEKQWRKQCEYTTCRHIITWIRHFKRKNKHFSISLPSRERG